MLQKWKRILFCVIAVALLITAFTPTAVQAKSGSGDVDVSTITTISGLTVSYSWTDNGTSYGNGSGSAAVENGTIVCNATSRRTTKYSYDSTTLTLTLKNTSGAEKALEFDVNYQGTVSNISSVTVAGATGSDGYHYSGTLADDASITVVLVTGKSSSGQLSAQIALSDFVFYTVKNVTVTFGAPNTTVAGEPAGSYTVDGNTPTSGTYSGQAVTGLAVEAADGYEFKHWITSTGTILGTDPTQFTKPDDNATVSPVFAPEYAAEYKVGTAYYYHWEEAFDAAKANSITTVIINEDGSLTNDADLTFTGDYVNADANGNLVYTVPAGYTLLVPYDSNHTLITNDMQNHHSADSAPGTQYRMLTVSSNAKITVNGAMCVGSQASRQMVGQVGPYGAITMDSGSNITINSGANLYAYGYIFYGKDGGGTVTVESGGTVYESAFIRDYPGNTTYTQELYDGGVFPMRAYTIRNVEVPMTLKSGATEYAFYSLYGTVIGGAYPGYFLFVGSDDTAPFKLNSGATLTKAYSGGKQTLDTNGNVTLNSLNITLKVSSFGTYPVSSSKTAGFPLPSGYDVNLTGGTLTLNDNFLMMEGSKITVAQGAEINTNGKKIYVLDATEDTGTVNVKDVNGTSYTLVDSDAVLDVNGTINVSGGGLYTSESHAQIISSDGTGQIVFTGASVDQTSVRIRVGGIAGLDSGSKTLQMNSAYLLNSDDTYTNTGAGGTTNTYTYIDGFWRCGTHSYTSVTVAPTCTEAGSTTYTCSVCGHSYSETIAATGHSYEAVETPATCIKDGYTTYTCSCGHVYVENFTGLADHNYVDGVCTVCGLGENALTIDYVSLSMENSLEMNFAFLKSGISDPSGCYVEFTKVNEDGTTTATTKAYDTWKSVTIGDKEYWYAVYSGLAAKEMSDMVYAAVYDSVDGVIDENDQLISQVKADSIQTQAMRNLETAKNKPLTRTMVVDMLNYGAAAQQKFNYHTNNLANSQLTDEQKAWATASVAYEDTSKAPEGYQANVKLESNIQFMVAIPGLSNGMNVEITFSDHYGTDKSYTLENITIESDDGYFYHTVEQTVIADAWQDITITVKDGETVVAEITDNIASYAARAMNKTGNELYEMIVKFSHSAKKYLHDKYNITEG